nr:APC family permease [uncultured Caproiciproducens sp.]
MSGEKKVHSEGLGFGELWALGLGQVIGAGIITTVGPAIGLTGYSVWLAYFAAIILGLIINLPDIIFSSVTKFSGGDYSIITSLGGEKSGGMFIISFFLQMLTMSLYGTALGIYIHSMFPGANNIVTAILGITVFYVINLMGTKNMATLQKVMSAFLVIALLAFAVVGCVKGNIVPPLQFSGEKFFSGKGTGFIGAVMILVYSCQGYKLTVNYGGMAKNPTRDLPRAMLAVVPALIILYCGAALSDVSILPLSKVAGQPLTVAARAMFSTPVFYAFMIGAPIMALATSMNSTYGMAVGPYMQATKDGWLPEIFGKTNRHGAPVLILTIQLVVGVIPVLMGLSVGTIVSNIMVITSVFQFLLFYAIFKLPSKMPKKWAKSSMHMSNGMLYLVLIIACIAQAVILFYSLKNLTLPLAIFNIAAVVVCFVYAILRHRSGKTHIETESILDQA